MDVRASFLKHSLSFHILARTKCLHIHLLFFDFYTLFAVCKQSLQINITILVSELNI